MIDIDTIKAGPELDALVAEKVMGWIGREHELWSDKATGRVTKWGTDNCFAINDATTSFYFRPSTDIAAAWEVVERVQQIVADRHVAPSWPAQRIEINWDGSLQSYRMIISCYADESASTAPLAVCRAALRAVGV